MAAILPFLEEEQEIEAASDPEAQVSGLSGKAQAQARIARLTRAAEGEGAAGWRSAVESTLGIDASTRERLLYGLAQMRDAEIDAYRREYGEEPSLDGLGAARSAYAREHEHDAGYVYGAQHAVVYLAEEQGLDSSDGKYVVVCEHNRTVSERSLKLAKQSARWPWNFCEECAVFDTGAALSGAPDDAETGKVEGNVVVVEGDALPPGAVEGLGAYGRRPAPSQGEILKTQVEVNHVNLTRFVWNRSLVEEHLRSCRYWIETAGPKRGHNEYVFKIDPPMPKDVRPWKLIGSHDGVTYRFFGDGNKKMACPTWDLPSGPPVTGGTCPGAAAAQTVVPPGQRLQHLSKRGDDLFLKVPPPGFSEQVPFREAYTICSACYAGEGNFDYGEIQGATLLRYWWTKEMLRTPAGTDEWVEIMSSAILAMNIPLSDDQYSHSQLKPIRIHSSGDFFSPAYARAWVRVANAVGDVDSAIRFWCPTRTWASPGAHDGAGFNWPAILDGLKQSNFVVRASAYHVGDAAPEGLTAEGRPGWARGTTALVGPPDPKPGAFQKAFPDAIWHGDHDPRRDHDCPVYALKKAGMKGSCAAAGCRVCWTRPDLRVNYALH